mgnify:CR=1 FL=1
MRTVTIPRSRVFHGPLAVVNRSHPLRGDIPTDLAAPDDRYPDTLMERRAARAFYIPCAQAEVDIPLPDTCCQLSGDNIGGLIVTAWEKPL